MSDGNTTIIVHGDNYGQAGGTLSDATNTRNATPGAPASPPAHIPWHPPLAAEKLIGRDALRAMGGREHEGEGFYANAGTTMGLVARWRTRIAV